jgi:hypothetical protein
MTIHKKRNKIMKTLVSIIIFLLLLLLMGCGSTASFSYLNDGVSVKDSTNIANIKLFTTRDIGRSYIELGGVGVSFASELEGKKYADLIKKEAAKIGADAVINVRQVGNMASGIAVKFR